MTQPEHTIPTRRVAFASKTERRPGRLVLRVLDGEAPGHVTIDGQRVTVGRSSLADADEEAAGADEEVAEAGDDLDKAG